MQIETPTSQDWIGFQEFAKREFQPREYVLVTCDGILLEHEVITGYEAGERNIHFRETDQNMRWLPTFDSMRPKEELQPTKRSGLLWIGASFLAFSLVGLRWLFTY
jgi:hypothetical protein